MRIRVANGITNSKVNVTTVESQNIEHHGKRKVELLEST